MNYRFLLNVVGLAPKTTEYMLGRFSTRLMWHRLFDSAPQTAAILGKEVANLVIEFMAHCEKSNISLGWNKHIAFLKWMISAQHPAATDTSVRTELLAATALAWANDQYDDWEYSRMVIMDNTNNMAVGAIRPRRFSDSTKVTRLGRGNTEAAIGETFVYGVGNDWLISSWKSL